MTDSPPFNTSVSRAWLNYCLNETHFIVEDRWVEFGINEPWLDPCDVTKKHDFT